MRLLHHFKAPTQRAGRWVIFMSRAVGIHAFRPWRRDGESRTFKMDVQEFPAAPRTLSAWGVGEAPQTLRGGGQNMLRIVIADNNRELCETLSDYVNAQPDMQVVSFAYDGEEALAVIKEHQPDVVLLDVTMPHLDGMAVLERMYELEMAEPPRVIMITALGREDIIQRMTSLGADYYLIKPFDLDLLVERIRQFAASDGVGVPHKGRGEARRNAGLEDERGVTDLLQEIGVPAHFKGYAYLRDAVLWTLQDPHPIGGSLTKRLYPWLAEKYGATPGAVEAAIRNAIVASWEHGNREHLQELTGSSSFPTNSVLIACLSDRVRLRRHRAAAPSYS